ncbi:MAG TPA: transcriptional regulator [Bacteroidales bacterium]|nr:transcriptional regulator [Bacteroidales bacterium]
MKHLITGLNKIFESRIRLGIMSILMVNEWIDYKALKELLDATDGNLASHLSNLEKHEMIEVQKQFIGRKPNTRYTATQKGKELFKEHLDNLNRLIQSQQK